MTPRFLKTALKGVLPDEKLAAVETGIDVVGDIAIVRLPDSLVQDGTAIGNAMLKYNRNVKAVYNQEGGIEGEFRLRKLKHLAGEKRTLTTHKENGCVFRVDVEKCYYSPRLSTERMRIADMTAKGEEVLNMFAGVGPYTIQIAKKGATVWSCEVNSTAYELHLENNKANKVAGSVKTFNSRAEELPALLSGAKFDRILMPHPSKANEYLALAKSFAKKGAWIHYYRHISAEMSEEADSKIREEILSLIGEPEEVRTKRARAVGPKLIEMVADIRVG